MISGRVKFRLDGDGRMITRYVLVGLPGGYLLSPGTVRAKTIHRNRPALPILHD